MCHDGLAMTRAKRKPIPIPLTEAVRLRLRALRKEREWTREDVAALARSHGLEWTHDTVKNVEAGSREVSTEELLVVLLMFGGMSAEEYFGEGSPSLALSASLAVEPAALAQIIAGTFRQDALVTPRTVAAYASIPSVATMTFTGQTVVVKTTIPLADQKAACVLCVSVDELQAAATRSWGHSLAAERDQRLEERLGERQVSPRSRQALRGHITRELLAELRQAGVLARRRARTRARRKGR
jgi:transcriptional regulator with XRE-family HTH domain